jgi:hypothetical protein
VVEDLGLLEGAGELPRLHDCREVEEGAEEGRHRNAVPRRDVLARDLRAVDEDPVARAAVEHRGNQDLGRRGAAHDPPKRAG